MQKWFYSRFTSLGLQHLLPLYLIKHRRGYFFNPFSNLTFMKQLYLQPLKVPSALFSFEMSLAVCVCSGSSWRRGLLFLLVGPWWASRDLIRIPLWTLLSINKFLSLFLSFLSRVLNMVSRTFLLTSFQHNFLPSADDWNCLLQCYTPIALLRPQTIGPNFFTLYKSHTHLATLHSWGLYSFLNLILLYHLDILPSSLITCILWLVSLSPPTLKHRHLIRFCFTRVFSLNYILDLNQLA